MKKISIIIPVYNGEKYIEDCIKSLIIQTYSNIEIIIINDCSNDHSLEICKKYADSDKRIIIIDKKYNEGALSARKTGLEHSTGEYIAFIDSDDWIEADYIEEMVKQADRFNADFVLSNFIREYESDSEIVRINIPAGYYDRIKMEKEIFPIMIYDTYFYNFGIYPAFWGKLIRKNLVEKYIFKIPNEINYGEDAACIYPLILSSSGCVVVDSPIYHYRKHDSNVTVKFNPKLLLSTELLMVYMKSQIKQNTIINQIYFYELFLVIENVINFSKKTGFLKIKDYKQFGNLLYKISFYDDIKHINIFNMKFSSKSLAAGAILLKIHLGYILIFGYKIMNTIKSKILN